MNHIILFGLSCKWIEREKNNFEENFFEEKKKLLTKNYEHTKNVLFEESTSTNFSSYIPKNEDIIIKKPKNRPLNLSKKIILSSRLRNRRFVYFSSNSSKMFNKYKPAPDIVES